MSSTEVHFEILDYFFFALVFIISLSIGLYFAFGSKGRSSTVGEYLFGNKQLNLVPVSLSIAATAISGSTTIGQSIESYAFGLHNWLRIPVLSISCVLVHFVFLPIFYDLQLASSFTYFEMRFDRSVKHLASGLYVVTGLLVTSLTIYVPTLAFQEVTGVDLHVTAAIIGVICIWYTAVCGLKGVVWTDVVQYILIIVSSLVILSVGLISVGGFENVWDALDRGKRLTFFRTEFDLTARGTMWACLTSDLLLITNQFGINQSTIQRFLSLPTLRKAKLSLWFQCFLSQIILLIQFTIGGIIYTIYETCDPFAVGIVKKLDQIFPHFVQEHASLFAGFNGIFIAGIFAAGLSTTSTTLNTIGGTIYTDFLATRFQDERHFSRVMKITVALVGILGILLIFLIERLGTIYAITSQCFTMAAVGILGLFISGMLIPQINCTGAKWGLIVSTVTIGVLIIGRSSTVGEYLFGNKQLNLVPVSLSIAATAISGSTIIGHSIESYAFGLHNWLRIPTSYISCVLVHFVFLPIFYDLQLASSFTYFEMRFDRTVKHLASGLYVVTGLLVTSLTIYVPSMAFQEVTGADLHVTAAITGVICIWYTTVCGLKGIVWTDVVQYILIIVSSLVILSVGLISVGGLENVWDALDRGKRLTFFRTEFDLTARGTMWACLTSDLLMITNQFGINQSNVQRFLSLPTLRKAKISLWLQCSLYQIILLAQFTIGGVIYTIYETCDPFAVGIVKKLDQIFPHFVQEHASLFAGFNGIFIAGIFAAGLSTTSTTLNTIGGTIYTDFLTTRFQDERHFSRVMKITVALVGIFGILLIFLIERLGTIYAITSQCFTMAAVGILGLFISGMLIPQINSTLCMIWNISYYTSPLIITFLYRRGYFVVESIASLAKISTGLGLLVAVSLCIRGIGRSQSETYVKFARIFNTVKRNPRNVTSRRELQEFDFDFKDWPVDWSVEECEGVPPLPRSVKKSPSLKSSFTLLPLEAIAYIAVHTFGLKMIYPGSVKIIQGYFQPMLIQGRAKLFEDGGERFKLLTNDKNEIDTFFVDNRGKSRNGKILVICSEGNAGFYEIGIMATPLELKYSTLGWNHPGFGGSTGQPYPDQDQNAVDAVMKFAIHKLGFSPENILLFGWSIGGYSSIYTAVRYPDVKGIILDATFDDILPLALPRMPESVSSIVRMAIRNYVNLHNAELLEQYQGPVRLIRRTEDEVIAEDMKLETNRGNFLLLKMLKYRFPHIFKESQVNMIHKMLSKTLDQTELRDTDDSLCLSLLMTQTVESGRQYPMEIGANFSEEQRNLMAEYLVRNHLADFKSSHCIPLPMDFFKTPWDIPNETDFVFT
ncbi:ABHD16A [Sergentomyia squamirostris]